eukprot:8915174-Pyramimonas_sp.AAC.1
MQRVGSRDAPRSRRIALARVCLHPLHGQLQPQRSGQRATCRVYCRSPSLCGPNGTARPRPPRRA